MSAETVIDVELNEEDWDLLNDDAELCEEFLKSLF